MRFLCASLVTAPSTPSSFQQKEVKHKVLEKPSLIYNLAQPMNRNRPTEDYHTYCLLINFLFHVKPPCLELVLVIIPIEDLETLPHAEWDLSFF